MNSRRVVVSGVLFLWLQAPAFVNGVEQALPVKDGRPAVAVVNEDVISLDEFVLQLDPPADTKRLLEGRATADDLALLERMITVRLIVGEAATMGLADLPEIRKQVDVTSRAILREVFMEHAVKDVEPDPAEVERHFRELAREYRTESLLFPDGDVAKRVREGITDANYAEVAARALADKTARTEGDGDFHRLKDYLPQIAQAVATLQVGQVSPVIPIEAGFVIVRVADTRYPETPEARAEARRIALGQRKQAALVAHEEALRTQYVVIKKDVLDSIDYAAKEPGIDALVKDTRVVAEVKGASPVTVGDLSDYLKMQFFHGGDPVAQGKRLNARKEAALDATLSRRVMNTEAVRLGLDKSAAYVDRINAFEDSLVFDSFVRKVILPEAKLKEEDVKGYYDAHLKDYSSPEMMRIRSLAFTTRTAAEAATEQLRAGTDYSWLAANAGDQVDKDTLGVLTFDGRPVTTDSMPAAVQKAVGGAKAGDVRLYASPENQFYVLAVQEVVVPSPRPYDDVKSDIAKKLYGEKLKQRVDDYAGKLRAMGKVEIYLRKSE